MRGALFGLSAAFVGDIRDRSFRASGCFATVRLSCDLAMDSEQRHSLALVAVGQWPLTWSVKSGKSY